MPISKRQNELQLRELRLVDLVAESLEEEAARMPPSMRDQAEVLRKSAKRMRQSDNPRMVRIHEISPSSYEDTETP